MFAIIDWLTDTWWRVAIVVATLVAAATWGSEAALRSSHERCSERCAPLAGLRFPDIHACVCVEEDGRLRLLREAP